MEPERPIEKLLRACAKKRRTGERDAFKLRPWVRRRLQDEVSKQFAEPDEESLSLWQLFRRQWALLVGFALFIFLGASLFLPALSQAKNKAKSVAAMSQLRQIGVAAQMAAAANNGRLPATLSALTNGYIGGDTLTDPTSGKAFVYVAGGAALDGLRTNAVLAYSPTAGKTRAVLFADGSVKMLNEAAFDAVSRRVAGQLANTATLAANVPAPAAPVFAAASLPSEGGEPSTQRLAGEELAVATAPARREQRQLFQNKARSELAGTSLNFGGGDNTQRFVRTARKTAQTPPVLTSFELRQNGNAIAIVDRDGSIYNGFIAPDNAATAPATDKAKADQSLADHAGQFLSFSVNGENRTLQQNVVFVGNISPATGNAETNPLPPQSSFAHVRITGTATLNATNTIKIDAVPVAP